VQIALLAGSVIATEDIRVESSGPAVFVNVDCGSTEIVAEGEGDVSVSCNGKRNCFSLSGHLAALLPE
jgi:hypothetical protein